MRFKKGVGPRYVADMMWNDGKIISDIVLRAAFFGTKGSIEADSIGPWRELRVSYGEKVGGKALPRDAPP